MNSQEILNRRRINQQIGGNRFTEPAGLIQWMGCIRAEDFAAAKWAIGTRVAGSTDKIIESAFNKGQILRTHVLNAEWNLVSPMDIRWMLALTSSRLRAFNQDIYRALGIDASVLKKSKQIIARALETGQQTRAQLWAALQDAHIRTDELRMGWLLMDAELDGLICSGGLAGRQFTYALLDQRASMVHSGEREEQLATLVRRYFLSRGPATIPDLARWSGMRTKDLAIGMELNKHWLASEVVDGQVYWFDPSVSAGGRTGSLFLLPALDEWTMAYSEKDFFKPMLVIDGKISGSWGATLGKGTVTIEVTTPVKFDDVSQDAMHGELSRYSQFLGRRLI
jgi:hypothetical protein